MKVQWQALIPCSGSSYFHLLRHLHSLSHLARARRTRLRTASRRARGPRIPGLRVGNDHTLDASGCETKRSGFACCGRWWQHTAARSERTVRRSTSSTRWTRRTLSTVTPSPPSISRSCTPAAGRANRRKRVRLRHIRRYPHPRQPRHDHDHRPEYRHGLRDRYDGGRFETPAKAGLEWTV